MQQIDMENWPRRELYDFMSGIRDPFYAVTFTQDVTKLYDYTKAHGLSFYHALTYLVTKAVNRVENFRYDIEGGKVVLLDERVPSFTELRRETELFYFVNVRASGTMEEFCTQAAEKAAAQTTLFGEEDTRDLIFISCLPWVELTSMTNEGMTDPDDCIPRISWGKWHEENGRKMLGICLEVNHRLIDGIHIGKFAAALTRLIEEL